MSEFDIQRAYGCENLLESWLLDLEIYWAQKALELQLPMGEISQIWKAIFSLCMECLRWEIEKVTTELQIQVMDPEVSFCRKSEINQELKDWSESKSNLSREPVRLRIISRDELNLAISSIQDTFFKLTVKHLELGISSAMAEVERLNVLYEEKMSTLDQCK